MFWKGSVKFLSSSWQVPCNLAMLMTPRTAAVIAVAPTILICKERHASCAPASAQEEGYLVNVCLGRIFGKYPIEMPI